MSNTWIDSGDGTGIFCDADADNNLIQLKLKKPKAWKWELTTSRSSPNIAMPRIMLFDEEGNLLVDADRQVDDAVYRPKKEKTQSKSSKRRARKFDKSATTDLDKLLQDDEDTGLGSLDSAERQWFRTLSNDSLRSKRKPPSKFIGNLGNQRQGGEENSGPYEIDIDSLQICEASDSHSQSQSPLPVCEIVDSSPQSPAPEENKDLEEEENMDTPWRRKLSLKTKHIESEESDNQPIINLPLSDSDEPSERQYISKASWKPFHSNGCLNVKNRKPLERRATSFKEVRFNVDPEMEAKSDDRKTPKRRCRRSQTNGLPNLTHSRSILERQSAMKCRLSSPEFDSIESHDVHMPPRYFLRTCRVGTLVVAEESGKRKRPMRRRYKTSSTENFLSNSSSSLRQQQKGTLNSSGGDVCSQSQSVKNFGEYNDNKSRRRKMVSIRRHRSDGNIVPNATSSEDEKLQNCYRTKHRANHTLRHEKKDVELSSGSFEYNLP